MPQPDEGGDKEERGRVLVVGGAREMPGAVILAASAALRAGAGKLQIATCKSIAQMVGATVPEARVFALPETRAGAISSAASAEIIKRANEVQAVLIGPGMIGESAVAGLLERVLPRLVNITVVLDAACLSCLADSRHYFHKLKCQTVLTPHAGEMAVMTGLSKDSISEDPLRTVRQVAKEFRAVTVLKGRETLIAAPNSSQTYRNRAGNVGLATSGSGDTLAGIVTGLAARGATPFQSAVWGVYLHARAGDVLARRIGRLGYLARELLDEVPRIMWNLSR